MGEVRGSLATEQPCERLNELVSRCEASGYGHEADLSVSGRLWLDESWGSSSKVFYDMAKISRSNFTGIHDAKLFYMFPVFVIGPTNLTNASMASGDGRSAHR